VVEVAHGRIVASRRPYRRRGAVGNGAGGVPVGFGMDETTLTVYWRPGCFFCSTLLRRLDAAGLRYRAVDIWEDPEAAAFVRSVARGNETVPTVVVGDRVFVNPAFADVTAALEG